MPHEGEWSLLPVIPLINIFNRLNRADQLNATSVCHAWRATLPYICAQRDSITLQVNDECFERNLFLTHTYGSSIHRLYITLDSISLKHYEKFHQSILNRYLESNVRELYFIASSKYLSIEDKELLANIKSLITEPILKCFYVKLNAFVLQGCTNILPKCLVQHETSSPVSGSASYLKCLSLCTIKGTPLCYNDIIPILKPVYLHYNTLQHLSIDYTALTEDTLEHINSIKTLQHLVLGITFMPESGFKQLPWDNYIVNNLMYGVTLNVIRCPYTKQITEKVLSKYMPLVAIRMLYCKIIDMQLVYSLVSLYQERLREFVWVDSHVRRSMYNKNTTQLCFDMNVNPIILLSWRCIKLRKIILHGYWFSAHDMLGLARLRASTLKHLEVSAVSLEEYSQEGCEYICGEKNFMPVVESRNAPDTFYSDGFLRNMEKSLARKWTPSYWALLPRALTAKATEQDIDDYIIEQLNNDINQEQQVTQYDNKLY